MVFTSMLVCSAVKEPPTLLHVVLWYQMCFGIGGVYPGVVTYLCIKGALLLSSEILQKLPSSNSSVCLPTDTLSTVSKLATGSQSLMR